MNSFYEIFFNFIEYKYLPSLILFVFILFISYKLYFPSISNIDYTKYNWRNLEERGNKNSELPPLYPNGWTPILESRELAPNQVKPIFAFGKDLIVFRGSSGKCYVFDAYCPHLGANLGVGGTVIEESIQCPFHGWIFNEEGNCTHIPGIDSIKNMNAKLTKYTTLEFSQFIFVWYHNKGTDPNWFPSDEDNFEQVQIFRGRQNFTVNNHIQDIFENAADSQHFPTIHSSPGFTGNLLNPSLIDKFFRKILNFEWKLEWKGNQSPAIHTANFRNQMNLKLFGFNTTFFTHKGFGCVYGSSLMRTKTQAILFDKFKVEISHIVVIIQKSPLLLELIYLSYTKPGLINNLYCKMIMSDIEDQIERDAIVWTNKRFVKNPIVTKNEPTLHAYRRWYKQFYEE